MVKNDLVTQGRTGKLFRWGTVESIAEVALALEIENIRSDTDEIVARVVDRAETEGVELTASLVRAVMRDRLDY